MVECLVCGEEFKTITPTHLKKHSLTTMEYKEKYDVKCLWDERTRSGVSGKNHHGYKPRTTFNCEHCGKEMSQLPCIYNNREHHFCGITCANKWRATESNLGSPFVNETTTLVKNVISYKWNIPGGPQSII